MCGSGIGNFGIKHELNGIRNRRPGLRQQGRRVGDALFHLIQQLVASCIISPIQGPFEGEGLGRPMTLEHQSTQAQQGGAVVPPVIYAIFKCR